MDRDDVVWSGYIPAITTPFDADLRLDIEALDEQIQWLAEQEIPGIILAGTTGEWFSMSDEERANLFLAARQIAPDSMWVIGGCTALTADAVAGHAAAASDAGLDGILVTPPPYLVPTQDECVEFYRMVNDAIDIAMCAYNWPRGCVVDMDTTTLERIAEFDKVVAIKNSTGVFARFLDGLYALDQQVRYFGIPTSRVGIDLVRAGHGDGLMGSGAPLGRAHSGFWQALERGDFEEARRLGDLDRRLMQRWFNPDYGAKFGNQQAIMKTALRFQGVPAGHVRPPLLELNDHQVGIVRDTLNELGISTGPLR